MGKLWDKCTFGRTRRARRMMRQLRALDRQDAAGAQSGSRTGGRNSGAQGSRLWGAGAVFALVAGLLTAAYFAPKIQASTALQDGAARLESATMPPAGLGVARDVRGRPPADVPTGNHAFSARQDDNRSPVAWDPCRQIHYVTSGVPPAGAEDVVAEAVQEMSKATGLQFVDDGSTSELPDSERGAYLPKRYGKTWAPVLVAWTTPDTVPALAGDVAGQGGPASATTATGLQVYVSGTVYFDRRQLSHARTAEGKAHARSLALHEFGHLLGLDHVKDPTQLMNPVAQDGIDDLQAGDREGLAKLGQGKCAPGL